MSSSSSSKKFEERKSRVESTKITWWYSFDSVEKENDFQLYHIRTKNFLWSRILLYSILTFIFSLYWPSIIDSLREKNPWVWVVMITSILTMVLSNSAALIVTFLATPQQMISMPLVDFCVSAMAVSNMIGFTIILYLQCAYDLCLPMAAFTKSCERDAFPGDVVLSQLFLPLLIQYAFPSFSWTKTLTLYSLCCFLALSVAWNSNSYHQIPLLVLAIIFSVGSLMTNRFAIVKSYLLQLDVEDRKEIEQEAKLSERLRLMISGIAHDLKSPLSALSLGCESVYQVYDAAHTLCYEVPNHAERMPKAVQLLGTLQEVAQWINSSKQAMSTIISRCVDINQALGGVSLLPTLQLMAVKEDIENLIKECANENPNVSISLKIGHGDESLDVIDDEFVFRTDRDWILENVNCLLSNAIKFNDYTLNEIPKVEIKINRVKRIQKNRLKPLLSTSRMAAQTSAPSTETRSESTELDIDEIEERLRIEVIDEGVGVEPETEKTLFSFLGHAAQMNVGGAGLGLYTLACRVKALNGEYGYHHRGWLKGEKLPGSVFWFEIPEKSSSHVGKGAHLKSSKGEKASSPRAFPSKNSSPRAFPNVASSPRVSKTSGHFSVPQVDVQNSASDRSQSHSLPNALEVNAVECDEIVCNLPSSVLTKEGDVERTPIIAPIAPSNTANSVKLETELEESVHDEIPEDIITEISSIVSRSGEIGGSSDDEDQSIRVAHSASAMEFLTCKSEGSTQGDDTSINSSLHSYRHVPPAPSSSFFHHRSENNVHIPPLRILVVDDSLPIRKMCAMILKQQGHIVSTAVNGKEALQMMSTCTPVTCSLDALKLNLDSSEDDPNISLAASSGSGKTVDFCSCPSKSAHNHHPVYCNGRPFDLVLMDIQMPVMDGIEAVQLYRLFEKDSNPCTHHNDLDDLDDNSILNPQVASIPHPKCLPIVGMSACSDSDIINRAIRAGMRDFMSKPFQMQQFRDIVAHIFHLDEPQVCSDIA